MERPKVILIGGAPLVGTGEVARVIAGRWGYGCVSTEDLIQAIMGVTSGQSHPHFHLLEHKDHRQYFITHTPARLATDAQYRHEAAWPAVRKVIEHHLEEGTGVVLEGWGLLPEKVGQVEDPRVRAVWLTAEEAFFQQKVQGEGFFEASPMENVFARKFAARSVMMNQVICRDAERFGQATVMVDLTSSPDEIADRCCALVL